MATVEQLSQALKNAHAAGDTAAAQKLAGALKAQGSFQAPVATPELGLVDTFTGGVSRGLGRLGSTFTDIIPAMTASVVGADEYAQEQFAEAEEKQALSQRLNPTQFESFKEVEGIGDFTRFAAETIGEQFGNLGLTVGTALTGGALAPVVGAAKATGQLAGAAFGSYALNAPEVFENVYRETGETAPGTALLFGAAAASLDSILPLALSRSISGPLKAGIATKLLEKSGMSRGVLRSGTAGLFSGLGLEGITEGAQEGISIAAERFIDDNPDVFGSKEFDRIMEASVRGAVAGGGFGTVGGSIEGAREGAQRSQRLQDLTEARELRDKINTTVEETFDKQKNEFGDALETVEENARQAQEARVKEEAKTQPKTSAEIFQDDATQFDAFGQPIQVDITEVTKFTKPQVQQEARRRARNNNTKVSEELKNVRAEVKAAKDAVATQEKERKNQEKVDTQRRKQLLDAEQLELNLIPSTPSTTVSEEAVAEGQGDIFGGIPGGEITRGPTVGKDLNKFINRQGLPANATNKKIFGGRDLAIPEQRQEVIDGLNEALETRNYNSENIEKIVGVIERLGGTPAQTTTVVASEDVTANDRLAAETLLDEEVDSTVDPVVDPVVDPKSTLGKDLVKTLDKQVKAEADAAASTDTSPDASPDTSTDPVPDASPSTSKIDVSGAFVDSGLREPGTKSGKTKLTKEQKDLEQEELKQLAREDNLFENKPTYKGKALNREQRRIAERGNFKQLLNRLTPSQAPEIQRVLRKISSQGLATKLVVGATPENSSGYYDSNTDTIVINPETGLTEHTFLHETAHASLSQALNNPDLQITKDFFKFYSDIKDQMGDVYGGQDLQEFTAELVGNPEFQALLKDTKAPNAPANKNLWNTIMEAIARFFGFRPQQSAYTKGLDFVDKILDVSQGVDPTLSDRLFLGTPKMGAGAIRTALNTGGELIGKKKESLLDGLSRMGDTQGGGTFVSQAMRALRLQDFVKLFGEKFPQIKALQDAILQRQGTIERGIKIAQDQHREFVKLAKELPAQVEALSKIAHDARRGAIDLVNVDKEFKVTDANKAAYEALRKRFNRLDPRVQKMYKDMRTDYRQMYDRFRKYVESQAENNSQLAAIRDEFTAKTSAIGYVPFLRFGDYFLEFNYNGERYVEAFVSPRKRDQYIQENADKVGSDPILFNTTDKAAYNGDSFPEGSFAKRLMEVLPAEQRSEVYQVMLTLYPANSFMQRTMKADLVKGESPDIVRGYGDTMLKWVRKQASLEYLPKIQDNLRQIALTKGTGTDAAVRDEIGRRAEFIQSPNYASGIAFAATSAYNLFLLGNVSSAVVNLSSVPLLTVPLLAGQYGIGKANSAVLNAMKLATGRKESKEYWGKDPKYEKLYEGLMDKAQLEHTQQREILEGSRQRTEDYDSFGAKVMSLGSLPFTYAETYSRATTAIATYDLAKAAGKSDTQAIDEAVSTVIDVHTSGMAAEGPQLMQNAFGGLGRVMFTFKSFIWNSAFVIARGMREATKNQDPEVRRMARRQTLGIFAMSGAIAGVNGLPFFGAAATFANMVNALFGDDDEPFNARDEMRLFIGDLAYKGPLNKALDLEISNRVGLANGLVFREDPYSLEQNGLVLTAFAQAMGPMGSYLLGAENALLGNGRLEALAPSGIRNVLKTGRFISEGGARTVDGEPIMEDLDAYNLALQAFGFTPASLSNIYEIRSAGKNFEGKVLDRRQNILKKYYLGITTGDKETVREALEEYKEFARAFPEKVSPGLLENSFKSRQQSASELINGLRFDKKLRNKYVEELEG